MTEVEFKGVIKDYNRFWNLKRRVIRKLKGKKSHRIEAIIKRCKRLLK
jgi:hypothetical protein